MAVVNSSSSGCRHFFGELEYKVEFVIPSELLPSTSAYNDEAVRNWVWENYQNEIKNSIRLKPSEEFSKLEAANRRLQLLDKITQVQRQYLLKGDPKVVFGGLLDCLLSITDSEYGFIGELKYEEDGTMYLQTHAITNIAWNSATKEFYDNNIEDGLKFYNKNSLFGTVMTSGESLIANDPKSHPKSAGVPEGHPPLNHFLGIPFFLQGGEVLNGMVGIANKPGGYSQADIDFLEPLVVTCSNLIQAFRLNRENDYLINTLEEKVTERTNELEKANEKVVEAAKMQVEHFACMSHEIRTPLNCIVGLSSLLQETQLNPFQRDSLQMIVQSGELLTSVVNDVLDYSKLQTGHMDVEIQETNLQDTLDAVVHSITNKAQAKKVSLKTYYDFAIPEMVKTDSRRLQQILYNLLGNAIKFSKDGGVVELSVILTPTRNDPNTDADATSTSSSASELVDQVQEDGQNDDMVTDTMIEVREHNDSPTACPFSRPISASPTDVREPSRCPFTRSSEFHTKSYDKGESILSGSQSNRSMKEVSGVESSSMRQSSALNDFNLRFIVKDYGKGIAKEDFGKIFEPFQQVRGGRESVQEGTGLGLSITSRLVKGLGGVLKVDSEAGKWSEFSLEIPFGKPVDVQKIAKSLKNARIYLVDKNSTESHMHKCLRSNGIDMIQLENCDALASYGYQNHNNPSNDSMVNICLIQEDLFNVEAYRRLADISKTVLITFGPKYAVKLSDRHFRSFFRTLPSVILNAMASCVQAINPRSSIILDSKENCQKKLKVTRDNIGFQNFRVLIAEDNLVNQKVLHHMLKRLSIGHVDIVDNGKKAVEQSEVEDYDVIFMDMQMPVMCGLEATKLIVAQRGVDKGERPHVFFVTAHATHDFQLLAKSAGGSGFISKPFNLKAIQHVFESMDEVQSNETSVVER